VFAGAVIVIMVVLAVRLAHGTWSDAAGPTVLVLGDSITDRGQWALKDRVGPAYTLWTDGKTSYRSDEQLPSAERWSTRSLDQVAINLGTNDVIQGWPTDRTAATLSTMVSLFSEADCVHLVTVNEYPSKETRRGAARSAKQLNEQIRSLASADPRVRIVDWAGIVEAELRRGVDPTTDGVHPSEDGYELLSAAYETSFDSCQDG
jgi:lysophospholipase L1-like esterase